MKRNWNRKLLAFCGSLAVLCSMTAALPAYAENEPEEVTESAADSEAADAEADEASENDAETEESEADTEDAETDGAEAEDAAKDADEAAAADDAVTDDNTFIEGKIGYRKLESGKGVAVSYVDQTATDVTVPKTAGGEKVIRIDEGAFSQHTALKSVKLPDTITEIGAGAFYYCLALESLEIPDSVVTIGNYAFANCYALKEIKLPVHLKTIPEYAFYYDIALESITIPEEVEKISTQSFVYCYSLRSMHIPASVTEIEDLAFVSCMGMEKFTVDRDNPAFAADDSGVLTNANATRLISYPAGLQDTSFTVPDTVKTIAPYAFSGAVKLENVTLPEDITELGDGVFSDCQNLTAVTPLKRITAIPICLFAGCAKLSSFQIPNTVTSIAESAFYGCEALTEMTIPESVTEIRAWAFFGCLGLQSLRLPDSVTEIGENAIGFCSGGTSDEGTAESVVQSGFLLQGGPESTAKQYAEKNGVAFKQVGLSKNALIGIAGGAAALIIAIAAFMLFRDRKKNGPAAETESADIPETVSDPNYSSILADDDDGEDPYDRSYGLQTEDTEDDSSADEPAE